MPPTIVPRISHRNKKIDKTGFTVRICRLKLLKQSNRMTIQRLWRSNEMRNMYLSCYKIFCRLIKIEILTSIRRFMAKGIICCFSHYTFFFRSFEFEIYTWMSSISRWFGVPEIEVNRFVWKIALYTYCSSLNIYIIEIIIKNTFFHKMHYALPIHACYLYLPRGAYCFQLDIRCRENLIIIQGM